jgi:hypothetical protein
MTSAVAAAAARRRNALDEADPLGAGRRNRVRACVALIFTLLWSGAALLVVTTVAPAAFRVLPSRALAGALVGQVLPVLFLSGAAIAMLAFALTRPTAPMRRMRQLGAMGTLVACSIAQGVIAPKIAALREQIGPNLEALPAADPLRVAFGQLHGFSVLALGVAMICALVTILACVRAVMTVPRAEAAE